MTNVSVLLNKLTSASIAVGIPADTCNLQMPHKSTSAQLTQRDRATVPMSEKFTVQLCGLYFRHDVIRLS